MNAPLRLVAAPRRAELAGRPVGPLDTWLGRLVKLVPGEVVAVYLAGRPFAEARFAGAWPIVCLVLVVIVRAFGTADRRGPQWLSVAVSAVSFSRVCAASAMAWCPWLAQPSTCEGSARPNRLSASTRRIRPSVSRFPRQARA